MSKIVGGVSKFGVRAGGWLGWSLKLGLTGLFFVYLIIHAVALGIQERDAGVVISELGREFYSPLETAEESALEMLDNPPESIISSIWDYWGYYYSLIKIFIWIKILVWLIGWSPLSNESEKFRNLLIALLIFYTMQTIYMIGVLNRPINAPFTATWNIIRSLFFVIANTKLGLPESSGISPLNCTSGDCVV